MNCSLLYAFFILEIHFQMIFFQSVYYLTNSTRLKIIKTYYPPRAVIKKILYFD
jgi:hypothetical protein